jgi:hypothetical protein
VAFTVRKAVPVVVFTVAILFAASGLASAGTVCDLSTATAGTDVSCTYGGAWFQTNEQHPAGTGFIDSFLRVQQKGWEQGYNTSARPVQFQEKTDPNFTRNLTLGEVGIKDIGGVAYREFFLDVNEPAATNGQKNLITLDQLEIFVSNKASLNNYATGVGCTTTAANDNSGRLTDGSGNCTNNDSTKIFDLDAGGDADIKLDYLVKGNGSGSSDMAFYLRDSLFTGYSYVYLFSQFGDLTGKDPKKYESQAGFEEWFTKSSIPPPNIQAVPEPTTLLLLGSGLAVAALRRRRRA